MKNEMSPHSDRDTSENTMFDWITQNLGEYISMGDQTAQYFWGKDGSYS